ncbi:rap guanine nucleotide exchange factor 4 isoform X1 [Photinus pyralis]|nr:rap guanine nucleotide exchange factor 4 isoform X1 [Photinus pyralis]
MGGILDVRITQPEADAKLPVTLCTLGVGATFGESILQDLPRDSTVVTQTTCELLRVEQQDFRLIWEKNKELMNDLVANCKLKNGFGPGVNSKSPMHRPKSPPTRRSLSPDQPNPAEPITDAPSTVMGRIGWTLRTLLLSQNTCLKDRKVSGKLVRKCAPGTELVDWILSLSPIIHTRAQGAGMWQALLEEGVISHVAKEQGFKDKCFLYRFWQDEEGAGALPTMEDINTAEEQIHESLSTLIQRGPDAVLRMILRKPSHERSSDDLETIYEELLHIRALSHLSNSIKRELASAVVFEAHPKAGSVLFHQGDEGRSWYIILRGSVDVVIHGKGTVTTLQEGDDFGKLALINDAPRAATIVLRENNCHFLRVDKDNFNRTLRDVEANTVRLKEHGKDVLILEKISTQQKQSFSHFKYTVMAGTPQKMLEHLLETRLDGRGNFGGGDNFIMTTAHDPFLDDFLLTHVVFMPTHHLVDELANHYRLDSPSQDREFLLACKSRVVQFVYKWVTTIRQPVFDDESAVEFLEDLASEVENDCIQLDALQEEASLMHHAMTQFRRYQEDRKANSGQKWKLPPCGQPIGLFSGNKDSRTIIMPQDDIIFRVYCADHTYCTLRLPVDSTAETIKLCAADKLKLRPNDELLLVEVKSNGERVTFKDNDISIPTALSLNGRIFVSPKDHLDALTCLSEQEESTQGIDGDLELFSTKELAYYMTLFDWDLFWCVHEYELLYHTFGRHHFGQITANLDVFLRRFNELQFWVVTEICMTSSLSKRVAVLRKFIKLAAYCKEYQNLNAFCAIVMGLSNMAISRLSLTWEKLPSKFRKLYTEFESLIDPSRNHRSYRVSVSKLQPPIVPFMPLLLKDMTFTHEGNKTSLDGLVNFEKMHMLAQTLRTIRFCRSRHLVLDPPSPKSEGEVKSYISCLRVIDNQRILTGMSQKLEPRRS